MGETGVSSWVFFTPGLPESHSRLWIWIGYISVLAQAGNAYAFAHLIHLPAGVLLASTVDTFLYFLVLCNLGALRLLSLLKLQLVLLDVLKRTSVWGAVQ